MNIPALLTALSEIPGKVEAALAGAGANASKIAALTTERDALLAKVTESESKIASLAADAEAVQAAKVASESAVAERDAEIAKLKADAVTVETKAQQLLANTGHPIVPGTPASSSKIDPNLKGVDRVKNALANRRN